MATMIRRPAIRWTMAIYVVFIDAAEIYQEVTEAFRSERDRIEIAID